MHKGTLISKVEEGITNYFIANELGELPISKKQADSDEVFLFEGEEVDYNVNFRPNKPEVNDEIIISAIPLSQLSKFMDSLSPKLSGKIISIDNGIYTIECKCGKTCLKREHFSLKNKPNEMKIAIVQDIINHINKKRKENNVTKPVEQRSDSKSKFTKSKQQQKRY